MTGHTTVLQTDILYDSGKSLNPAVDLGQVNNNNREHTHKHTFILLHLQYSCVMGIIIFYSVFRLKELLCKDLVFSRLKSR